MHPIITYIHVLGGTAEPAHVRFDHGNERRLADPDARAPVDMMHEFMEPFTVGSSEPSATAGLPVAASDDGVMQTVLWYQTR